MEDVIRNILLGTLAAGVTFALYLLAAPYIGPWTVTFLDGKTRTYPNFRKAQRAAFYGAIYQAAHEATLLKDPIKRHITVKAPQVIGGQ